MHFRFYINLLQTKYHFSLQFSFHLINLLIIKHLKNKRSIISQVMSTYRFLINQPQSTEKPFLQQLLLQPANFSHRNKMSLFFCARTETRCQQRLFWGQRLCARWKPGVLVQSMGCRCVLAGGAMHLILCRLENMTAWIRKDLSVLPVVLVGMLWCTAWWEMAWVHCPGAL